ncbi:MAG TPA: transcriptional regulator [Flavobacteriales bacterium]|nr:transcriptional regulator [Flavobacteriales bacterium]
MKKMSKLCSASVFTDKLGGKWKLAIIYNLRNRKLRFGQLATRIDGVSRKVLTDHLKQMEDDGLIKRESFKETPPRVEYSLTHASQELEPVLVSIDHWVTKHQMPK